MAYTIIDFKTKIALKGYVKDYFAPGNNGKVKPVRCFQSVLGPDLSNYTGRIALEGPHYPKPHTWYAEAELKEGVVIKVR